MPALVIPQILLCGLFVPRDALPRVLEVISDVLPLSYAVDAMQTSRLDATADVWGDVLSSRRTSSPGLALGALTLRRQTPGRRTVPVSDAGWLPTSWSPGRHADFGRPDGR